MQPACVDIGADQVGGLGDIDVLWAPQRELAARFLVVGHVRCDLAGVCRPDIDAPLARLALLGAQQFLVRCRPGDQVAARPRDVELDASPVAELERLRDAPPGQPGPELVCLHRLEQAGGPPGCVRPCRVALHDHNRPAGDRAVQRGAEAERAGADYDYVSLHDVSVPAERADGPQTRHLVRAGPHRPHDPAEPVLPGPPRPAPYLREHADVKLPELARRGPCSWHELDNETVAVMGEPGPQCDRDRRFVAAPCTILNDCPPFQAFPGGCGDNHAGLSTAACPRMGEHADGGHPMPHPEAGDRLQPAIIEVAESGQIGGATLLPLGWRCLLVQPGKQREAACSVGSTSAGPYTIGLAALSTATTPAWLTWPRANARLRELHQPVLGGLPPTSGPLQRASTPPHRRGPPYRNHDSLRAATPAGGLVLQPDFVIFMLAWLSLVLWG